MRYFILTLIFGLFLLPTLAQDETLTPYEIALQSIEEARATGATRLDLSGLGLTELPPEIGNLSLSNLEQLWLQDNQLSSLPVEIGYLYSLRTLNLNNNQLTSLPPEIGNLSNLWILLAGNNQISSLPPEIFNLSNLFWLSLFNNQLNSLPPEIGNLRNIDRLELAHNQLSSLPPEIAQMEGLCYLNLRGNHIRELPREFGQLTGLINGCDEGGFLFDHSTIVYPPREVNAEGTASTLEYLRSETWWYFHYRLIPFFLPICIVVALLMPVSGLGFRWKNRRRGKEKEKRS